MNKCLICGQQLHSFISLRFFFSLKEVPKSSFCSRCCAKLTPINQATACPGCGRSGHMNDTYCSDCQKWAKKYPDILVKHRALFAYNDFAKSVMEQYKFQNDYVLAHGFVPFLQRMIHTYPEHMTIVPIPSSAIHFKKRGFVPTECLLKTSGLSYVKLLVHLGEAAQSGKTRKERLSTPQPFRRIENIDVPRKVLLFDDVYTTGRTLFYAKEILSPYVECIESFSLFR
ncbi:ComF family protein [Allofustis seminis]|uniref:ComF family protein n=1 Tax=Allofustis seminis TaxID=166939 RepID=UPI00037525C3|nr:ComF family protein [Allofustis seminis]